MATPRYSDFDPAIVNANAGKNLIATSATVALGYGAASAASKFMPVDAWNALAKDTWILQGVLVAAIVALIYKLQGDIAGQAGLSSLQRAQLDRVATTKSQRLWALFFAIAVSALLPRIAEAMSGSAAQVPLLFAATLLQTTTALLCLYLPGMWQELRRFTTSMIAEKERKARQQAELDRLEKSSSK
jgi:hypothetical protein